MQEILLDCAQFNVLLVHIIQVFFRFFAICIRDPASISDGSDIVLTVTIIKVVIENCLPIYLASLSKYGASKIVGSRP